MQAFVHHGLEVRCLPDLRLMGYRTESLGGSYHPILALGGGGGGVGG